MSGSIKVIDIHHGKIQITVPDNVRWMATDRDGALWFYRLKPVVAPKHGAWVENSKHTTWSKATFAAKIYPPKDYTDELYTWR